MITVEELFEMHKNKQYKDIIPHLRGLSEDDQNIFMTKVSENINSRINDVQSQIDKICEPLYELYLSCPLATITTNSDLYNNQWCVQTGMACMHPHPHRYFTKDEFLEKIDTDDNFVDYLNKIYKEK